MLLGMVVDLGLDQRPLDILGNRPGFDLTHYLEVKDGERNEDFYSLDARRAYLGCYYLSCV
jgi:hypothetical protein